MSSAETPRVRVLDDNVADKDEFGSHQRIADAIAGLINSAEPGRSIALTGKWGSGKSSVLKMMKELLKDDTKVFTYDAWAHEGDPLHRSFLEQLGDDLTQQLWISSGKWKKTKEKLSKRRETIRSSHFRKPTILGYILSLLTLLIPLGLLFLNQSTSGKLPTVYFWIGWGLTVGPFAVALLSWLLSYVVTSEECKQHLRYVVSSSSRETTRTDTRRTPDPTSIEFRDFFRQTLEECFGTKSRKLVIVVDNLDRLDHNEALAFWSTMRTLVDHTTFGSEPWIDRVWLLVPFDRKGMNKLWNGSVSENNDRPDTFLRKTFQIEFHVPLPVLSKWEDYFTRMLKCALPDIKKEDNGEAHDVYSVFHLKGNLSATPPTPRQIKVFINRVCALYLQWPEMPLKIIALYVAIEHQKDLVHKLQTEPQGLVIPFSETFFGQKYDHSLAALHFNVDPAEASHVLLIPRIQHHINSRNIVAFEALQEVPDFDHALEEVVATSASAWAKGTQSAIPWVASRLKSGESNVHCRQSVMDTLCEYAMTCETWRQVDEEIGSGLNNLIEHDGTLKFAQHVLTSISITEPQRDAGTNEVSKETYQSWLRGCELVVERLPHFFGSDIPIEQSLYCPGSVRMYLDFCDNAVEMNQPPSFTRYLKPSPATPVDGIVGEIAGRASSGLFLPETLTLIRNLSQFGKDWPWDSLIESIAKRVTPPTTLSPTEDIALFETLLHLSNLTARANDTLIAISSGAWILHHLDFVFSSAHTRCTALYMYLILKHNPAGVVATPEGKSPSGLGHFNSFKKSPADHEELLNGLLQVMVDHNDIDLLFGEQSKEKSSAMVMLELRRRLALRDDLLDLLSVKALIANETDLYSALYGKNDLYQETVDKYCEGGGLSEVLSNSTFDPDLASLYVGVLLSKKSNDALFIPWVTSGVKHIPFERWESELQRNWTNLFSLLEALVIKEVNVDLDHQFRGVLELYCERKISGETPKVDLDGKWPAMLASLKESLRKTLIDETIATIIDSEDPRGSMIELFGDALLDCARLELVSNQLIQKGFKKFTSVRRIDELRWFADALDQCPKILEKARKENRETFVSKVSYSLKTHDLPDEVEHIVRTIANTLGIEHKTDDDPPPEME